MPVRIKMGGGAIGETLGGFARGAGQISQQVLMQQLAFQQKMQEIQQG